VCTGDCNGDGSVTIDELITGVAIVLETTPLTACPVLAGGGTGHVDVSRLLIAVTNAIDGCPAGVGDPAIGVVAATTRAMSAISAFALSITAAVNGSVNTSPAGVCPEGGTNAQTCQDLGGGRVSLPLNLSNCGFNTAGGVLLLDGTVTLTGKGYCPGTLLPAAIDVEFDVTATLGDKAAPVKVSQYAVQGTLGGVVFGPAPCAIAGGHLTVNGSASEAIPGRGTSTLQMHDTRLTLLFGDFNSKCEPAMSSVQLDGDVSVADAFGATPFAFDATLSKLSVVERSGAAGGAGATVSGAIDAACAGGPIEVTTADPLSSVSGDPCPTAGMLTVASSRVASVVEYAADGSVEVDASAPRSCLAEPLRTCAP
jgi:hypothetical protein